MDRKVLIPRARLTPWLAGFATRHGAPETQSTGDTVVLTAPDGARAEIDVPFPPPPSHHDPLAALIDHVAEDRWVAAILVRRGGHAVGLFHGVRLEASKVGHGYVQGRTKAGGWSQQRYARRRANQESKAYASAADDVAATLLPRLEGVEHLALGGHRPSCAEVLADPRLVGLAPLAERAPFWQTPDPRQQVLETFPSLFLGLTVRLNDLA